MGTSGRSGWPIGGALVGLALASLGALTAALAWTRGPRWFELHTTALCCITSPRALHVFALERDAGIALGVLLALLAWPAARAASRRSPKELLGAFGRYALATLLALLVSEGVLRVVHPVRHPTLRSNLPLADADERLGWRYRPLHTKVAGEDPTVEYDTDVDGNRARSTATVADHDAPTILFAGESITAGIGLAWDDTYGAIVADRLGLQGANLGVHGYGVDQVYSRTLESLDMFKHPVALVTLFVADELERLSAADRAHPVLASDGSLVQARTPALWRESALRDLLRRATHYDDADEIALAHAIFRTTVARAREHGAVPLFVMTNFGPPCVPDRSGKPALEHVLFDDLAATHLRVDLDPEWRLHDDLHPDARGARKLADAIARALTDLGVAKVQ